jgi:hypothetical protein
VEAGGWKGSQGEENGGWYIYNKTISLKKNAYSRAKMPKNRGFLYKNKQKDLKKA